MSVEHEHFRFFVVVLFDVARRVASVGRAHSFFFWFVFSLFLCFISIKFNSNVYFSAHISLFKGLRLISQEFCSCAHSYIFIWINSRLERSWHSHSFGFNKLEYEASLSFYTLQRRRRPMAAHAALQKKVELRVRVYVCASVSVCARSLLSYASFYYFVDFLYSNSWPAKYVHTETKRRRNEHFASFDRRLYWQWRWLCRHRDCAAAVAAAAHTHTWIWVTWASFCFVLFRLRFFLRFLGNCFAGFFFFFWAILHTHTLISVLSAACVAHSPHCQTCRCCFCLSSLCLSCRVLYDVFVFVFVLLLFLLFCLTWVLSAFFWGRKLSSTH